MTHKILCPECGSGSAADLGGVRTCVYYPPFVRDGVRHHHDGNSTKTTYQCDNGHEYVVSQCSPCPAPGCQWGRDSVYVPKRGW